MSITVTKIPPLLSLAGNPVECTLESNNMYETEGVTAMVKISFTNLNGFSSSITFSWTANSVTVTAFPYNGIIWPDPKQFLQSFINQRLESSYQLNRDFKIYLEGSGWSTKLVFEARQEGADYNLTHNIANTTNETTTGVDEEIRDFFRIAWQLEVYDSDLADYQDIGELQLETPDEDGEVTIDISNLLQSELLKKFTYPETTTLMQTQNDLIGKFRMKYCEVYGNPVAYYNFSFVKNVDPLVFYFIQGAISYLRMTAILQQGFNFYTWLISKQKFLTFSPARKYIHTQQPEKLYLFIKISMTAKLYAKAYFTDGTTSANTLLASKDYSTYDMAEFIVGYGKAGIAAITPAKTVKRYDIWVENSTGVLLSEVKSFIVDHNYYEFNRFFIFKNSLGMYESFWANGLSQKTLDIDKEFIRLPVGSDFDLGERSEKQSSSTRNVVFKCSTGFKDRDYINYISEFLNSDEVYYLDHAYAYPVNILAGTYRLEEDKSGLFYLEFQYKFAMDADSTEEFLKLLRKGSFNDDYNNSLY